MNNEITLILPFYDRKVSEMITDKYGIEPMSALRRFLLSETYKMLINPKLEMWDFSPFGI